MLNRVKPGHCRDARRMTALAPKPDLDLRSCYVAEVPLTDKVQRSKNLLFSITLLFQRAAFCRVPLWRLTHCYAAISSLIRGQLLRPSCPVSS